MITEMPENAAATPPPTFADYLPEDAAVPVTTTFEDSALPADATGEPRPPRKRVQMSKKMKKTMDGFVRKIAELPLLWFKNQAQVQPEWTLDKEEEELLTESITTVFEVLDVGFEIEQISMTLTSIWWVISYPFVVFGFIFLTKKAKIQQPEELIEP